MTDPRIEAALAAYCRELIEEPIELVMAKVLAAADAAAWRTIETAKKDGSPILAKLRGDIYPPLTEASSLRDRADYRWNGLTLVLCHPGLAEDGFDMGWNVQAPVGHGGFPDSWIEGWQPLHATPEGEVQGNRIAELEGGKDG